MKTMNMLFVCLLVAGLFAASGAESYRVTLFQDSYIGDTMLKPGEYTLSVDSNKVIFNGAKQRVAAIASKESAPEKFNTTSVRYTNGGDG
ncbi:MAG: hypothetical protein ACRD44_05825, partial [Bryobacteraceae bacterium]